MGYLPKHIKRRRHRWNVRIIAHAVLAGAVFVRVPFVRVRDNWGKFGTPLRQANKCQYLIKYADGKISRAYDSRGEAASVYLLWWFDKNDIWPKRRRAA